MPPGMRAVTIRTPNLSTGVAGFVLPGNKVDVLLTVSGYGGGADKDPTGGGTTITLLQNVEILAVDQNVSANADQKFNPDQLRSVTLLVKPDEAARLELGQNKGSLHLTLRNGPDVEKASTTAATLRDFRLGNVSCWDEQLRGLLELWAKFQAQPQAEVIRHAPVRHPADPSAK